MLLIGSCFLSRLCFKIFLKLWLLALAIWKDTSQQLDPSVKRIHYYFGKIHHMKGVDLKRFIIINVKGGQERKTIPNSLVSALDRIDVIFVGRVVACWVPPEVTLLEVFISFLLCSSFIFSSFLPRHFFQRASIAAYFLASIAFFLLASHFASSTLHLAYCWISLAVAFCSTFSSYKYIQRKSGLLESSPDRQVYKN